MGYIQKIFKRAKIKHVADHLLYGYEPDTDIANYERQMEEAFAQYGEIADKYGGENRSRVNGCGYGSYRSYINSLYGDWI